MPYPATTIALKFVNLGIESKLPITQMKLQKMLYLAQGIHLVQNKQQPLLEESFQAWKYGPVIPSIYHEYRFYGSKPIIDTKLLTIFGNENAALVSALNSAAEETISATWDIAKGIDALKLSNWTHKTGSPWANYYQAGTKDIIIPNETIADYFSQFIKKKE